MKRNFNYLFYNNMKNITFLQPQTVNKFLSQRMVFLDGAAEKQSEKPKTPFADKLEQTAETKPDNKGERLAADTDKQIENKVKVCEEADAYFVDSVARELYAANPLQAETNLINASKAVPWLAEAVNKYKSDYDVDKEGAIRLPAPNVLVERMANALYSIYKTKFTRESGKTQEDRLQTVTNYIYEDPENQKQKSERATQASSSFADLKKVIAKGRAA